MRILITGSKGFVGSRLLEFFKNENIHDMLELDNDYFADCNDWEKKLLEILDSVEPQFVFHVGADANTLEQRVNHMMIRNYESTKILVNWCSENDVPFIYSSSAANYGINGRTPSNLYGWSKYVAEDYVTNNKGIALRYFNVYGPGESGKGKMASFLYQSYIKNLNKEKIYLFPKRPRRDFVHIDDIVSANKFAFTHYNSLEKTYYEVGTGTPTAFEELMDYMGFEYGYETEQYIPEGYQFYTCSNKKKWIPGWTPKFTIRDGVEHYKNYLHNMREI